MPKKLSSAVVGTLAVGLTMPLTANAAAAAPADLAPLPSTGVDTTAASAASLSTVDISAARNATQFRYPLAQRSYSYTSPYGARCMPVQGASTYHLGQDLGAVNNSLIYSVADGTVVRTFSGNRYSAGYVVVQHRIDGKTFHSAYFHMWDANTHVKTGQTVKAGQAIARVGSSGPSTAPHLHLEIWEGAWLSGKSHDPTTWLAQRGINLRSAATSVMNISAPASCDYYTATSTPLRSSASSSSSVIMQLAAGTALTAVPGDMSNSMVRVKTNGRTGWVAHSAVTPSRPSGSSAGTIPASSAPKGTSVTPTKYRTTTTLNARSGPGTNYGVLQGLATGTEVTVTAKYGSWLKFSRNGQTVWSHSDFLTKVSGSSTTTPATSGSSVGKASGTYKVQPGGRLNVRTGAGTSNSVAKTLAPGTTIKVNGKLGSWLRFDDGSRNLWVHKNYVNAVTAAAPASSSSVGKASGTYKVQPGGRLNVRTGAGTSNSVAKTLAPGTTIKVNGKLGSWLRFDDGSRNLWVHKNYVNPVSTGSGSGSEAVPGVNSASGTFKVQPGGRLNVRTGAGTSNSVAKTLAPGTTIKVNGKLGSWLRFDDGSRNLWVHKNYVNPVTAAAPASSSSVGKASGTYKVQPGGRLNVRTGAGTSNSVAKTLAPGTTIKVNGKLGSWLRFDDGSRNLWVHKNYVNAVTAASSSSSSGVSSASGTYKVQSGVSLNVRTEASTSSSKVKTLKSGTTIKVTGKKGSWVSYKDGSRTLWVHSGYLDKVSASRSTGSGSGSETVPGGTESSKSSASTSASGTYRVSSGVQLNARTGASTSNSSVKVLKAGTTVKVTGEKGDWVSFKDGSRTLWVHADYLTKADASTESSRTEESDSSSSSSSSSKSSTSSTTAASGSFQVKSGISLNARTGASASSSSAKVLKAGTKVSVTGKKGEWVSFKDGSRTLWVHSGYLVKASASGSSSSSSSSESSSSSSKSSTSSTTAASGSFQVKSGISLNARTGASASSSSAKVLKAGTKVSVTGKKGEWVSFKDGSRTLWVHSGYLVKASAAAPSESSSSSSSSKNDSSDSSSSSSSSSNSSSVKSASGTYHVRSGVYLNARSGPDISNRVVLNLNPKREIQITGRSGDWVRFTYSGKDVWVKAEFLEKGSARDAAPESSSGSTSGPAKKANSTNSTSKVVGVAYSTNSVNVRMGPSTNNSAMFSVRTGTKVELLEKKKDGWQEVRVNGATGWMSAQLLTSKAPSSTGTANSGSTNSGSSGSTSGSSSSSNMHAKSKNGPYSAVWDKLAQCESGQNWKIDTGNGFYGGVQFSPESWEGVGGSGFPHEASKEEQIKRAYMLWKKQGWNAWPHCTSQFGFKGDPGGYGDSYYKVHPSAKTASTLTQADSWTATYSVPLRESAATSSDKLVQVPRGTELKQLKRDGSWLKVEYTSGGDTHTGWVNTSYISQA